jgi:hypothetical protein
VAQIQDLLGVPECKESFRYNLGTHLVQKLPSQVWGFSHGELLEWDQGMAVNLHSLVHSEDSQGLVPVEDQEERCKRVQGEAVHQVEEVQEVPDRSCSLVEGNPVADSCSRP